MAVEANEIKAEIDKIRQEELIRLEIQNELAPRKPDESSPIWEALNSNFGLWLLSAIFISGFGALYTNHQNKEKERQQIEQAARLNKKNILERIDRLSMEFSYRLSSSLIRLEAANTLSPSSTSIDARKTRVSAFAPLTSPAPDSGGALYPEFKDRSGLALLAELSTIAESGERAELKDIITRLSGILNAPSSIEPGTPAEFQSLAGKLLESTKHWRWDTGFRYTDCKKENPFC